MKTLSSILICLALSGCTLGKHYEVYVDTQKTLNKDYTAAELARISALLEIVKTTDNTEVKLQAIRALQEIQRNKRPLNIEKPKNWFGF